MVAVRRGGEVTPLLLLVFVPLLTPPLTSPSFASPPLAPLLRAAERRIAELEEEKSSLKTQAQAAAPSSDPFTREASLQRKQRRADSARYPETAAKVKG